ncbi:winged helix-turn-helix transcriptional regulator [Corynebacterium hindlerae]|uniref:Winged helix-turn-helix transcriptional regulator n=1 Tax=Corynebacterium hindlerae TaxID=699041 RepID=A0A7G5FG42_9CORY|nr:metalloregulator ArsR/SmtB family transcription factor [Corynebacterium hindlerae]QMV85583.1 winged helix-turn-helix transcriptional regulator [Corynebacterium hindlerae]QTH58538.1 winged helix-turn-helix transcriptional regulator [Corynebacterium hindlerae]
MHKKDTIHAPDLMHANLAAESFRILSDPTRIRIIWLLLQGEFNVNQLAETLEVTPSVVSQHLAKLKTAQLVNFRREGTFMFYSAKDEHLELLLSEGLSHAEHVAGDVAGNGPHSYRDAMRVKNWHAAHED